MAQPAPASGLIAFRRRVSRLFDDTAPQNAATRLFNAALAALIVVNVTAVIVESVDSIHRQNPEIFWWIEAIATFVFAVEYLLRVWTAVDINGGRYSEPLWGRLRYMRSFFALVDLVAVLPAVLGVIPGADDFRVLRLLRLLRMLKLTRHSTVFSLLWAVVREEARSIAAVLFIVTLTLVLSASLLYMIENDAQPTVFSSIPAAMWWAVETLTTVGYGDMVPVTPAGKLVGGIVSIVGIGTLALFSGLITVSFMDQLRLRREQLRRVLESRMATGPLSRNDIRLIERYGDRLGLPEEDTEEVVEEAIVERPGLVCPNCGHHIAEKLPTPEGPT
ncbi:MAG TPA: ion transporter [Stellaceae bacterium]|nr:ion transporter [Stellaceae bacterium]